MMIIIEMTLSVIQWKNWGSEREKNFSPEHTMAKSLDLILNFALLIQEPSVTFGLSHFQIFRTPLHSMIITAGLGGVERGGRQARQL